MTKNTVTTEAPVDIVEEGVLTGILTPYAAAKLVNNQLRELGLAVIPPQMMYNYTTSKLRAGKKPLIKFTAEEGVDRDDLQRWTAAYITKKQAKGSEPVVEVADPEQAAFDAAEAN
jgi:hypothetical protein